MNPPIVVLFPLVDPLAKHLSFYESFIFMVTLLFLNMAIYWIGKQEGISYVLKELKRMSQEEFKELCQC